VFALSRELQLNQSNWRDDVGIYSARLLAGLFSKDPDTIAGSFSSNISSREDMVSGVRLINFYLNHSAKGMNASRRRSLEKARKILSDKLDKDFRERETELRKIASTRRAERAHAIELATTTENP
jgi:hypothetical protein